MTPDSQLQFSDSQAITADAASSDAIDLGVSRRLADGTPLAVVLCVEVAADFTTGNETYEVEVQTDGDSAFGSPTTIQETAILASELTLGSIHVIPLRPGVAFERYLRLNYDVSGTTPTATVSAYLMPLDQVGAQFPATKMHYPDNIAIQ